ncbi:hypothetical protein ACN42_g2345 [Penicillium freii]|uniref:Nucleoside phosphorylase domain-containing protein n=1 Tax=Penicillium freii TaxID=48697 RepID=A0A101MQ92_PENFR|nr:hypothetical protein ACN42_g2345 [Penicillium freii]
MEMLDEEHNPLPQPSGDTNVYNLGSINGHNVVIAGLPRAGNCSAATVMTQMRMTFPNLKYGLLVGIGGGVPKKTEYGMICLGHVVVSAPTGIHSGALQYDHGKAKTGRFERKGCLAPPPTALLNAAREMAVRRQRMDHDPIWENAKRVDSGRRNLRHFKFPGTDNDNLFASDYEHRRLGESCENGGCDLKQRINRPIEEDENSFVVVHRGTIASGELVIKDAKKRDDLAEEHGVLCFEMEAAGVLADFPCMVIRGISDYCDSHKNDVWHGYAAAVAAAYARQLFFQMSIEEQGHANRTPTSFELPFNLSGISEVTQFIARDIELNTIQDILDGTAGRRTAILQGLGGIGKTQLAIAYIKRHRTEYSAMIWLNARDETTIKQSFTHMAEWILRHHPAAAHIEGALESRDLDQILKAVIRWLDEPRNDRWLLVYDNYDNPLLNKHTGKDSKDVSSIEVGVDNDEGKNLAKAFDLRSFLPEADHGAIIVTTRSSAVKLGQIVHLGKLEDIKDGLTVLKPVSGRAGLEKGECFCI